MKISTIILASLIIVSFFSSCIEMNNELDDINYKPALVIEGLVVDREGLSYIRLGMSSPGSDSLDNYIISDAIVEIVEDGHIIIPFNYKSKGLYTNSIFCGKVNSTYTLNVSYNGKKYSATSSLMPVTVIDSLIYRATDTLPDNSCIYKIFIYAKRALPDYTSFYRLKLYHSDSLYNAYSDLLLLDDQIFESFENLEIPYVFNSHDTIRTEVYSLTQEVYNYYSELSGLTNGNLNSIYFYPQNPVSNISNGALGVFQTSAVSSKEIILP